MTALNRRLGVLISGRGSNLQAIMDAIADNRLDATISFVISNRAEAAGLARGGACLSGRVYEAIEPGVS